MYEPLTVNRSTDITAIPWSVRAQNCFSSAGVTRFGQLVAASAGDLLQIDNFGRKALRETRSWVARYGLALAPHRPHEWLRVPGGKVHAYNGRVFERTDLQVTDCGLEISDDEGYERYERYRFDADNLCGKCEAAAWSRARRNCDRLFYLGAKFERSLSAASAKASPTVRARLTAYVRQTVIDVIREYPEFRQHWSDRGGLYFHGARLVSLDDDEFNDGQYWRFGMSLAEAVR